MDHFFSVPLQRKNDKQGLQNGLNHVPMSPYCPRNVNKKHHIHFLFRGIEKIGDDWI